MADVSVTFGATDEGLEKTLKALQSETDQLKLKMRTTEMSVTEAGAAMKKIAQNNDLEKKLRQVGDESQGASSKVKTLGTTAEDTGKKAEIGFGKIAVGATLAGAAAKLGSMAIDAAFSAATKTIASFGDALDMGGRLNDLADRTGIAVDKVLLLERAFQNAGVGADSLGPILNKMQKALVDAEDGTSKAAYAFADLGLSLSQLRGLSPEEQLRTIGKAIAGIPDPAQRAATAMEIFGKSGGALNQVFANFDDEIQTAKLQLGSLPDIMKAGSSQFDRISDNLVVVGGKFIEFAAGLIDKVKPALDAVTTALSMFDAAKVGQEIGAFFVGAGNGMKLFQKAVDEFKTGNFTDGFKLAWQAIVEQAKDTANSIYTKIVAAFKTVGEFAEKMFNPTGALGKTILDFFEYIGTKASVNIMRTLAKGLEGSSLTAGLSLSLNETANDANKTANKIEDSFKGAGARIKTQFGKVYDEIPASFEKNLSGIKPLFDDITKKQDEVVNKTQEIIDADKEWEAQVMDRINNDVDASQKAVKEKKAGQKELADGQSAEDERAANARKKYEDDHKVQAQLKRDQIADQIKINNAIADGDTKLADSLKNTQALEKTIKELADAGLVEATGEAAKLANELARSAREADRVKNSLATKIGADIKKRQESEAVDPSGKLQKKAQEQIAAGQYKAAEATGRQLAARELETSVMGAGEGRDMRSAADTLKDYYGNKAPASLSKQEQLELTRLAREEGVFKDFSKITDSTKKGLDRFADLGEATTKKIGETTKAVQNGVKPPAGTPGGGPAKTPKNTLDDMVESILDLIEKIEPKLPTAALV
jgi:ABC-type antimicrobial peptide transport system permease subunit